MKVYLFISNQKKLLKMYLPYIEALNKQLDITNSLVDADIVLIIGAWTWQGAQIAKKAKQMDIPYIVCPLGDISERNCKNPYLKRSLQQSMYQKAMYAKANLVVRSEEHTSELQSRFDLVCRLLLEKKKKKNKTRKSKENRNRI